MLHSDIGTHQIKFLIVTEPRFTYCVVFTTRSREIETKLNRCLTRDLSLAPRDNTAAVQRPNTLHQVNARSVMF